MKFATDYPDDESSEDSGELSDREGRKVDESSIRITFENVSPITLTRNFFSRYCHYPHFESAITGCFTKVRLGDDYRFVRIEGLVDVAKYSLEGVLVDQGLEVGQGSSRRVFNMDFASNSAVTSVQATARTYLIDRWNLIAIPAKSVRETVFLHLRGISTRKPKKSKNYKTINSRMYAQLGDGTD